MEPSTTSSALLSFTAENVRSYSNEVHLSMLGTRLAEADAVRDLPAAGTRTPMSVLPVAGVFGANASGKSTLLRAMHDMRTFVLSSFRQGGAEAKITRHRFLLHGPDTRPSRFQIELILDGVRWQYGFEIDDRHVLGEYAYHYPRGRQALVFRRERNAQAISFGPVFRSSGNALARLVPDNALLLSVAGAAKDTLIGPLFTWFRNNLRLMESGNRDLRIARTADLIRSPYAREGALALLQAADLGIADVERFQPELEPEMVDRIARALRILNEPEDDTDASNKSFVYSEVIRLLHVGRDGAEAIDAGLESQGTLVWLGLVGPVLQALQDGTAVLIDELDVSLHPHLAHELVSFFQGRDTNRRCAQLIFNAHDTSILGDSGQRFLGRDQIWFTEKDIDGGTTLYPLSDFRPKGDEAVGRRYLQGRYGAVPVLNPAGFRKAADTIGS